MPKYLLFTLVWFVTFVLEAQPQSPLDQSITKAELKAYSEVQQKLNPKNGSVYRKVVELFGECDYYTVAQVTAATDPLTKAPFNYDQRRRQDRKGMPIDAFSREQAQEELATYQRLHPNATNLWNILVQNYGDHPWYRADELRDVEANAKPGARKQMASRPLDDPVEKARLEAESRTKTWTEYFRPPAIRQSWRDVLYDDDRGQPENQPKALKDLVGATVSYAHNGSDDVDTWTLNGALILPWSVGLPLTGGWTPARVAVAPSVTVNRLDTNGDPKKEADSLLFRIGTYGNWFFNTRHPSGLQVRATPVFATDTGWNAKAFGFEMDLEPRWQAKGIPPLGYRRILIGKQPLKDDETDKSRLDFQLRSWVHLEGGDVQNTGKSWDTTEGDFLRMGPTVQLQLNAPGLVWGKDFSVTTLYSYYPALSGPDDHNSFWKISGVLNLFKEEEYNRKVSLTIEYQRGGLVFTKEDVDILTVGLGILY